PASLSLHDALPILTRRLVGPPAQEAGPVAEASSREVIVANLDHELGRERLPLPRPLRAPSTGPARGSTGEAGRLDERCHLREQSLAHAGREPRGEADVMQETVTIVEPEEQGSDHARLGRVAEAAH